MSSMYVTNDEGHSSQECTCQNDILHVCLHCAYNMYMCMQIDTTHYCELIMILAAVHGSCCTFGQYMTVSCGTELNIMLHCHVGQCRPFHFKFMAFSPYLQREREFIELSVFQQN